MQLSGCQCVTKYNKVEGEQCVIWHVTSLTEFESGQFHTNSSNAQLAWPGLQMWGTAFLTSILELAQGE